MTDDRAITAVMLVVADMSSHPVLAPAWNSISVDDRLMIASRWIEIVIKEYANERT